MTTYEGRLLVATPSLLDPNFARSVVLLIQHDEDGALGVVLTHPSESPLADHLPELGARAAAPDVVFVGGPVEPEVALGFELGEDGEFVVPGVRMLNVVEPSGDAPCRVFSGYAGWGPGQLEGELSEGAWYVVDALAGDVFSIDPEGLWAEVLRRQPGRLAWLATYPPDPSLN